MGIRWRKYIIVFCHKKSVLSYTIHTYSFILSSIQNMKKILFGATLASVALIGSTFASTNSTNIIVGGDSDEHGCKGSAGYIWSGTIQTGNTQGACIRPWEHNGTGKILNEATKEQIKEIREKAKETIKNNRENAKTEKKEYREAFHADYGYIRNYFTKLTDKDARKERQTTVDNAVKTLLAEKNKLNTEYRTSVKNNQAMSAETVKSRVDTMVNAFYNSVIKYIDPAKKEGFDAFIAGKSALYNKIFTVNQLNREKNQQVKKETKETVKTIKTTAKETKKATKEVNKSTKKQVKASTSK